MYYVLLVLAIPAVIFGSIISYYASNIIVVGDVNTAVLSQKKPTILRAAVYNNSNSKAAPIHTEDIEVAPNSTNIHFERVLNPKLSIRLAKLFLQNQYVTICAPRDKNQITENEFKKFAYSSCDIGGKGEKTANIVCAKKDKTFLTTLVYADGLDVNDLAKDACESGQNSELVKVSAPAVPVVPFSLNEDGTVKQEVGYYAQNIASTGNFTSNLTQVSANSSADLDDIKNQINDLKSKVDSLKNTNTSTTTTVTTTAQPLWGGIAGSIYNQTDLQGQFDTKITKKTTGSVTNLLNETGTTTAILNCNSGGKLLWDGANFICGTDSDTFSQYNQNSGRFEFGNGVSLGTDAGKNSTLGNNTGTTTILGQNIIIGTTSPSSTITLNGALALSGTSAFNGITNTGSYTQTGSSANTLSGPTTLNNTLTVAGTGTFNGITNNGTLTQNGNATVTGALSTTGNTTLASTAGSNTNIGNSTGTTTITGTFNAAGNISLGAGAATTNTFGTGAGAANTIGNATGTNTLVGATNFNIPDNTASALSIAQGGDNYFNVDTTNGAEAVNFGNTTTNPGYNFLGTGTTTFGGPLSFSGNLVPSLDNSYDLGTTSLRFRDLFLGPTSLHVSSTLGTSGAGANYTDGTLSFTGSNLKLATTAVGAGGQGSVQMAAGTSNGVYVESSGNVGINNIAPTSQLDVVSTLATSNALTITANSLTTSSGLNVQGPTAGNTFTGELLSVNTASTGASSAGFARFNFSGDHTGSGLQVDDATTTGDAMRINANSLTTGRGLYIVANSITTARALSVVSSSGSANNILAKFEISANTGTNTPHAVQMGITGNGAATGASTGLGVTNGSINGYVVRFNDDGTYTDTDPFTVDVNGNVGIGTLATSFRLDLRPNTSSGGTSAGYRKIGIDGVQTLYLPDQIAMAGSVSFGSGLGSLTTGDNNTAVGLGSMTGTDTGSNNTVTGFEALFTNSSGSDNSSYGYFSMYANTNGSSNSAFGSQSLNGNTTGSNNSAFGYRAMYTSGTGSNNSAFGYRSQDNNASGGNNASFGYFSLLNVTSGSGNVAFGYDSGSQVGTGSNNTFVGNGAGNDITTGVQNIAIGYSTNFASPTANGQLNIGNLLFGTGLTSATYSAPTGVISIGNATPNANVGRLYIEDTGTHAAYNATQMISHQLTTDHANNQFGLWSEVTRTSGDQTANAMIGSYGYATATAGTINEINGMRAGFDIGGATVTDAIALKAVVSGIGTATNAYGIYIDTSSGGAVATNNFGLYQATTGVRNYFAGNIGIGSTAPNYALVVNANGASDGAMQVLSGGVSTPGGIWVGRTGEDGGLHVAGVAGDYNSLSIAGDTILQGLSSNLYVSSRRNNLGNINFTTRTTGSDVSRMYIANDGNVGIGTTSPTAQFYVSNNTSSNAAVTVFENQSGYISHNTEQSNTYNSLGITSKAGHNGALRFVESGVLDRGGLYMLADDGNAGTFSDNAIYVAANGNAADSVGRTEAGVFYGAGPGYGGRFGVAALAGATSTGICYSTAETSFTNYYVLASCTSSARYKENINPIAVSGLDVIRTVRPVEFKWKNRNENEVGFIAEDLEKIDSRMVYYNRQGQVEGIKQQGVVPYAVKAIQELDTKFLDLNASVEAALGNRTVVAPPQITFTQLPDSVQQTVSAFSFVEDVLMVVKNLVVDTVATFNKAVTFVAQVTFKSRVIYEDKDMAGYAVIKSGANFVKINFNLPYEQNPIINVTPNGKEVLFAVKDVTENGFTISLKDTLSQDIMFNWTAIYVANVNTSTSDSPTQQNNINTQQITPTVEPQSVNILTTLTPTPTIVEQELTTTPTPSIEAQQQPEITLTPTPTVTGQQQSNTNNNEVNIDQILEITPTPMSAP